MNIPNLVNSQIFLDDPTFWGMMAVLIQELQSNLSNEGFVIPSQSTANIAVIQPNSSVGTLIYDSTTNQLKVNINGTFKVIQTI